MRASAAPAPRPPGATKRSFITPMRAARVVDHVQKIVAKPTARPLSSRAMQLHALARGVGDERAAHPEQVLVAGRDLVEVAVAAHQREQLREVVLAGDLDPGHWSRRYRLPAVYPAGTLALHLSVSEGISMHRWVAAATIAVVGLVRGRRFGRERRPGGTGRQPVERVRRGARPVAGVPPGSADGIYYRSTSTTGDAGFFLAVPGSPGTVYGFSGSAGPHNTTDYTPVAAGAVTGSGTAADPLKQDTVYGTAAAAGLQVTQTTSYVNGSQFFTLTWVVKNADMGAAHFKAFAAADFFFDGSDRGTGIYTEGPPRFIGGTNADTGNSGGFAEVPGTTPWSAISGTRVRRGPNEVWGKIEGAATSAAPTFDNTVVGEQVDNAGGVEWDQYATGAGLAASATATFSLVARSAVPSALQINPPNAGAPKGVPINFTVGAFDTNGSPYAGRTLRYSITGVEPGVRHRRRSAPTATAMITDPGTNAGADTVVAFLDFNNDGTRQAAEPQASALATFVDNVPPACTRQGHRRPAGRQRRRGQAARHHRQLQRGVHRHRADDASAAQQPHARGDRRQEEEAQEEEGDDQAQDRPPSPCARVRRSRWR